MNTGMTAYAVAFVYTLYEDPANAKIFAEKALAFDPPLASAFATQAQKIFDWATASLTPEAVELKLHSAPASVAMEYVFKLYPAPVLP